jgi:hypothetical protein
MSSGGRCGGETSRPSRIVGGQPSEHLVADPTTQDADRLGLRIPGGPAVGCTIASLPG